VRLREFLLENLAGDLEYHPRRAILYLALAVVTHAELAELSNPFQRKSLPSIPNQAAQIVQDFEHSEHQALAGEQQPSETGLWGVFGHHHRRSRSRTQLRIGRRMAGPQSPSLK
jgi:hypothetical protein